ncbi:MAG: CofH family radical SAM protein [Sedimentisphaerales bacterium]|nr:CofH family radical SAM protein [Sedimentisphaerales bacterium]
MVTCADFVAAVGRRGVERITAQRAEQLYRDGNLHELCRRGGEIADLLHGSEVRTYAIERNINYTNICGTACSFCAFSVGGKDPGGYTLTVEEVNAKIEPLVALGGTQILLQGGMNPALGLSWYEDLLRGIKGRFAGLHIHGFSPAEIAFMAGHFDMPLRTLLERLREAGLDSIPGGGAEILVDSVRQEVSPGKCSAEEWLEVSRQAHRMGICTTATMMFGHVETVAERIEHLQRLRDLQDESLAYRERTGEGGYFTAFICWPFQGRNTRLGARAEYDEASGRPRERGELVTADAVEQLRMTALARIFLDNVGHIQASWVTMGAKIAQLSLLAGCDDAGSLMMEENVVSAAGTCYMLELETLRGLIRNAGFEPQQRDFYYRNING